jgi:hypothetical protein
MGEEVNEILCFTELLQIRRPTHTTLQECRSSHGEYGEYGEWGVESGLEVEEGEKGGKG